MESLGSCVIDFELYPRNLPNQNIPPRRLDAYSTQLDENAERLFSNDARLLFWDLHQDAQDFELIRAKSLEDVRCRCLLGSSQQAQDNFHVLECRFVFLYSINSRSQLFSTREMLMLALSYHTIEPWFLDFLFTFGEQDDPEDSRFSSFRHITYSQPNLNLANHRLNRTGHELHLCYNLRAPETTSSRQMPWSLRQTVMYHSFDLESGQAIFFILKGNDSMSKSLTRETQKYQWKGANQEGKLSKAFFAALRSHVSLCWWSCENWRKYISHLETSMNQVTSQAIWEKVRKRPAVVKPEPELKLNRAKWSDVFSRHCTRKDTNDLLVDDTFTKGRTQGLQWKEELNRKATDVSAIDQQGGLDASESYQEIEFPDLQRAQLLEEKSNEALYALSSNIKNVKALGEVYSNMQHTTADLQDHTSWLSSQLEPILYDLEMHRASLETLARSLKERKNLLLGILEFQNMQASKYFAQKAQLSADAMEGMTDEMRKLTKKTKDQTVSMTAIAGVTMFFLPGTFVSTLMSTDVVQWEYLPDGSYQLQAAPGARHLFLALTLPLTVIVFAIWALVNWRSRRGPSVDAT